jgi:integrase
MGTLYKQKNRDGTEGRIWWLKYYVNGRPIRESSGTDKETVARGLLKAREGRAAAGLPVLPRADRIQYVEVADDLKRHYETTGRRSWREVKARFDHLGAFFGGWRVAAIGAADVDKYVAKRQAENASNGTINRELGVLSRMLRLAHENGKLLRLPRIRKLKEAPPRSGFFEREQFEAVRRQLHARPDLQAAITLAFTYGWRMQSEVLTLERRNLDLDAGTLRLDPGATKNDEGRLVYLTPDVKAMLAAQVERVRQLERQMGRIVPALFPYLKGLHRGEPIRDFRKAWRTACRNAGVSGRLRHDFRRTAVRNMVNAGVPERVAMTVTGHRTRSVFDRYHIVSPADLQEAARKIAGITAGITG